MADSRIHDLTTTATTLGSGDYIAIDNDSFATAKKFAATSLARGEGIYNVLDYGAVGDGSTDDTVAIQAAITAAIAGRGIVVLPPKTYKITDTLTLTDATGIRVIGQSGGSSVSTDVGTVLMWYGDAASPAVQLATCRYCTLENMQIFAQQNLLIGVEIRRTTLNVIPARNRIENVKVQGHTNKLGRGFVISADVDANNDFNIFINCSASNYGEGTGAVFTNTAGFSVEQSQSLGNLFINCFAVGSATGEYGFSNAIGSGALGSFSVIGGGTADNTVATFYIGIGSGIIAIEDCQCEGDAMLLLTTGPAAVQQNISMRGVRYNPEEALNGDDYWIKYMLQGTLELSNCQFETSPLSDQAGQIFASSGEAYGGPTVIVIGGFFQTTASDIMASGTQPYNQYILAARHYDPSTDTGKMVSRLPAPTIIGTWYQENVAASQAAVALNLEGNNRAEVIMPQRGFVTGIAAYSNAARSAGTLTVDVTIDGTVTGLQAVLNGSNTQTHTATQILNNDAFVAGKRIGVKITTDADWAPTTADITVTVMGVIQ
jgi:hypothetical protein